LLRGNTISDEKSSNVVQGIRQSYSNASDSIFSLSCLFSYENMPQIVAVIAIIIMSFEHERFKEEDVSD
jgi:hypothetical protein